MINRRISLTVLIFVALCLWIVTAFGQPFPEKPTARLGKGIIRNFRIFADVTPIAYSPDGKLLAVASSLGVWLFDSLDYTEIGLLEGESHSIAISPDGKMLASGSLEETILLWDIASQQQVGILEGGYFLIAFHPNGKTLVSSSSPSGDLLLWDVSTQRKIGQLAAERHPDAPFAISPDGKIIASEGEGIIELWEVTSQELSGKLDAGPTIDLTFSPDGSILASLGWGNIRLWDVDTKRELGMLEVAGDASSLAISPDGKTIALGLSEMSETDIIELWDIESGKLVGRLEGTTSYDRFDFTPAFDFSTDGRTLAVTSIDGTVRLWNVETQQQVAQLLEFSHRVGSLAFSPDGSILASLGWGNIQLWEAETQRLVGFLEHTRAVSGLAFSADGKIIASWDTGNDSVTVWRWDVSTQQQVGLYHLAHDDCISSVAISLDGKLLASALQGGCTLAPAAFWQDGDFGPEGGIWLWDVESQKQIGKFHQGHTDVRSLAFSPDGRLLAATDFDDGIFLWDVETQAQLGLLASERVDFAAFSPDGKWLATRNSSRSWDKVTVTLWEVESQQQVWQLHGYDAVFSPDSSMIAAPDGDNGIRFWNIASQQEVGRLESANSPFAFSPDGKWLASGESGAILLWEVNLPPGPVAVEPGGKQVITLGGLKRTQLLQNYPNPFNPETWIPFVLAESGEVEIRIYSTTGHLVRTLQLGRKEPGIYQSKAKASYWDGKNDAGELVSSGVYFYELYAGQETFVRKAMLLK